MIVNRIPIYIGFFLCLITIYTLFNIKNNVITMRMQLNEINKQMEFENDTIQLLKAEFTYLSSPKRLRKLNDEYLGLRETKISQMTVNPLNKNDLTHDVVKFAKSYKKKINWRYKKRSFDKRFALRSY